MGNIPRRKIKIIDEEKRNWISFYEKFQILQDISMISNSFTIIQEGKYFFPIIMMLLFIVKKVLFFLFYTKDSTYPQGVPILRQLLGLTPQKITNQYISNREFESVISFPIYYLTIAYSVFARDERMMIFFQIFVSGFYSIGFLSQLAYLSNKNNTQLLLKVIELTISSMLIISSAHIFLFQNLKYVLFFIICLLIESQLVQHFDKYFQIISKQLVGYIDISIRSFKNTPRRYIPDNLTLMVSPLQLLTYLQVIVMVFLDLILNDLSQLTTFRSIIYVLLVLSIPNILKSIENFYMFRFPNQPKNFVIHPSDIGGLTQESLKQKYMMFDKNDLIVNYTFLEVDYELAKQFIRQAIEDQQRNYGLTFERSINEKQSITIDLQQHVINVMVNIVNEEFLKITLQIINELSYTLTNHSININNIASKVADQVVLYNFLIHQNLQFVNFSYTGLMVMDSRQLNTIFLPIFSHLLIYNKFLAPYLQNNPKEIIYDLFI